ncbi:MAG: dockerin type I domain-containing protein [Chthoniobacterales bacterium]
MIQNAHASILAQIAPSIPSPIRNFDGIPFPGVGCNCAPPDTDGEVGATQYVQMVNEGFQVFDKNSGASLLGPNGISSLWAGFGGVCELNGNGDPVVLYDQLANRWVITQFAGTSVPTNECIAVSTTNDATGTYARYSFLLGSNFFDYPHLGLWPDAYYCSFNVFNSGGTALLGTQAFAFDRAKMLAGLPATFVTPGITPGGANNEFFLPADLDGSTLPPAGAPANFIEFPDGGNGNAYRTWHYHVDFATPANSTFTQFANPPAAGYTELCPGTRSCIPNLGGGTMDGIGDRLMFRLAYRNFGDHESVVGNYSVSAGGVSGIRWFEIRGVTAGPVTVFQESTYQPDTTWRWMGSAAMDGDGNLAIGFSASSATINPQIRYAGRFVGDPLNTLSQGETTLFAGTGSPTGTANRWGDYSDLTVDPVDDHTFWYTQEYYSTTGSQFNWRTRIGSFKFSTVPTNNIVAGGSAIVSAGGNGVLDPGETVTVSLGLRNIGGPGTPCTTAGLTGTLQAGGGVTSPSGPQNYGVICTGNPVVFRNFTFTVDPAIPCGSTVTASLAVVDGAENFGTITFTFTTGSTVTNPVQNFDGVVAPALPAGWTGTASGSGIIPTTVTTFPDTAPNSVFTSEAATVGLSEVTSAPIAITSAGSQLSFRNEFNTESGFDGRVLEISIPTVNAGAFQDILAAGGTFASGGYNSTLSTGFANPLPGRMAWTGLSGGTSAAPSYITTVVNLPAAAVGQSVMFKWRQGSDSSVVPATNPGSRIDTITLVSTICGGGAAPVPSSAVSRKTHGGAGTFDINLPLVAINGAIGVEPRVATAGVHQIVVTFPTAVTVGSVAVTTGTGNATSSVAGGVVTINLTGVTDQQRLGVTLMNVSDGTNAGNVLIPIGILQGDVNGSRTVSSTDVAQTKANAGAGTVNASTFATDVNVSGTINSTDVAIVKGATGHTLP